MTHQDHKHVVVDGEKWFLFCADYQHEDRTFTFDFYARTYEEAIERLRSIRTTAIDCHQVYARIPAEIPGAGLFVRAWCFFRNLVGI